MTTPRWKILADVPPPGHPIGALEANGFTGRVEIPQPRFGVHDLRSQGQSLPAIAILAVEIGDEAAARPIADWYVRGDDLIATFAQDERRPVAAQVYWRCLGTAPSPGRRLGLELIVSVQTDRLHSEPLLTVASDLLGTEIWRLTRDDAPEFQRLEAPRGQPWRGTQENGQGVFVVRAAGHALSYAQMVHPSDCHRTLIAVGDDGSRLAHELFPDLLEKGVIRRGRVRGWFVERSDDLADAWECYRAWLTEPPPLTV